VLPYFKSIERYAPGEAEQRGKSGPILVEDYRTTLDLTRRFVEAAQQAGLPLTKDLNGVRKRACRCRVRFRGSTARTFRTGEVAKPRIETARRAQAAV
jgi:choline dehydrogenase